jgi:hypothetical protein
LVWNEQADKALMNRRWLWLRKQHLIDCESGKASAPHKREKSGAEKLNPKKMKKLAILLVVAFMALVTPIQAQKTYKASDVVDGKTISSLAKDWDLQAFQDTKELYKPGMSQESFIALIKSDFPSTAKESFKDVFVPYFEYIYTFHARGFSDSKVSGSITGNEAAALMTNISLWDAQNPGQVAELLKTPRNLMQRLVKKILDSLILDN